MYCVTMAFSLFKGEETQTDSFVPPQTQHMPCRHVFKMAYLCGNCWEACWSSPVCKEIAAWGPAEHAR